MPSSSRGTWQISPSYDLNYLNTLKFGDQIVDDASRQRLTQSILLETGYSFTDHLHLSTMFTYMFQSRIIEGESGTNTDFLYGLGDAIFLLTYRAGGGIGQKWEMLLGAGPKLPLGRSDMKSNDGITYNADLQPGSGAWDGIFWGLVGRSGILRPSSNLSLRLIYRYTGVNMDYLGFTEYGFGNELQVIAGLSEQILIGTIIFNPSVLVRFRYAGVDSQGGRELPNTGGRWVYVVPGLVYQATPGFHARLAAEIPIYSYLQGVQLTTNFRITTGLYFKIGGRKQSGIII